MDTFKTELLDSDLPNSPRVSLQQAVCWLSGLPIGNLDDPRKSTPTERTKAQIGRSQKSAQFWLVILGHLASNPGASYLQFPWGYLSLHAQRDFKHARTRRWAERLIEVAQGYCKGKGTNPSDVVASWTPVLQFEVDRIWAVREALSQIARHLAEVCGQPSDGDDSASIVREILARGHGFRLSLKTGALYELPDPSQKGVHGIELWARSSRDKDRMERIETLTLSTARLVEFFIERPSAKRDNWVKDKLHCRYWPIDDALGYLKFDGDWLKLWELSSKLELMGCNLTFEVDPKQADDDAEPSQFDASDAAAWLVQKFRHGRLTAFGVRKGTNGHEPIPVHEWSFLGLKRIWRGKECIRAIDQSGLTSIEFDHVAVDAGELMAMMEDWKTSPDRDSTGQLSREYTSSSGEGSHAATTAERARAARALLRHFVSMTIDEARQSTRESQKTWLRENGHALGERAFQSARNLALEDPSLPADRRSMLTKAGARPSIETVNRNSP